MEINNEKMKHLRIEHLPNNIAWLRQQIQEHNTQLDDLCKVRVALEAKADPIVSGFYQICDVNAKLCESQTISQKKLNEAVYKSGEMQKTNKVHADKVKEHILNCKEERENLVRWMSDWSERVTDLSKQFLKNSKLLDNDNLNEEAQSKRTEAAEYLEKIKRADLACEQLKEQKNQLEKDRNDTNSALHFLKTDEAAEAVSSLTKLIEEQKVENIKNQSLLKEKQELERFISEHKHSTGT